MSWMRQRILQNEANSKSLGDKIQPKESVDKSQSSENIPQPKIDWNPQLINLILYHLSNSPSLPEPLTNAIIKINEAGKRSEFDTAFKKEIENLFSINKLHNGEYSGLIKKVNLAIPALKNKDDINHSKFIKAVMEMFEEACPINQRSSPKP